MPNTDRYYLPVEDVNDDKARIVDLFFNTGDKVKKNDSIYSFETTKAIIEVETESEGFINYFVSEGEEANVGSLVCEITKTRVFERTKTKPLEKLINIKPTKKALILAEKHDLEIEKLGLKGIIREKDLIPFTQGNKQSVFADRCLRLDRNNKFILNLFEDATLLHLSSKDKIERYKANGHKIGDNVTISKGALLIGNNIVIKSNVSIGVGTYLESPEIYIGANTSIGNNCEFTASRIRIGEYNKISNKVYVDISGGRFPDSNLITGKGCLIGYETYLNVCRQVKIGKNVALSPKSIIYTHSYWQSVLDGYPANFGPVTIEDNSWLGSMAQVFPNVIVGTGSTIISNSFVTGDVKPFTMVGGVPAKVIKRGLKKSLSATSKEKIIRGLFSELSNWLYSHHYDIEIISKNHINISNANYKRSCMLLDKDMCLLKENNVIDIIITNNFTGTLPKTAKTVFDINNVDVVGPIENIEYMIIEFFRRKGIRFYEK